MTGGFDLDEAIAALPAHTGDTHRNPHSLNPAVSADIPDDLLREFACRELGALRCSTQYLDTLRMILGNQAQAERRGYVLAMNLRVPGHPMQVVRNIVGQMSAAGITFGKPMRTAGGVFKVVQCFGGAPTSWTGSRDEAEALLADLDRQAEDRGKGQAVGIPQNLSPSDIPY